MLLGYLFVNRYRVVASIKHDKAKFFTKKQCLFLDFQNNFEEIMNTSLFLLFKTIRLFTLNFYEVIVNSGFALVNYYLTEMSSS